MKKSAAKKSGVKIALIVEGRTEKAFGEQLRKYLNKYMENSMPDLNVVPCDGGIPTGDTLKRTVQNLLSGKEPADYVIALTDVYTGDNPPKFRDAAEAKNKMRSWVGDEVRFYPHAAQHDFEAWLLPYWDTIQELAGHNKNAPAGAPETVNHDNPPAYRLAEIFRLGKIRSYSKPREARSILERNGLEKAIDKCPELKALVNTILNVCGAEYAQPVDEPKIDCGSAHAIMAQYIALTETALYCEKESESPDETRIQELEAKLRELELEKKQIYADNTGLIKKILTEYVKFLKKAQP
jgi:hypothetical protein